MPINLAKGQKVDLTKGNPGLKKIMVGLGWDVNAFDSGSAFDLDAAVFMVGSNGKCPTEKEFVFYGNLEHESGSVKHLGDNLTGEGTPLSYSFVAATTIRFSPKKDFACTFLFELLKPKTSRKRPNIKQSL